jgi:hypothetical protein
MRTVRVEPQAAMLIESMRDIGYSLQTALADIIDNSITAEARSIQFLADTTSLDPRLAVLDDGAGMIEAELLDAMRPGTRNPLDERDTKDLGRFGLGLKTASFSQCRRLTVVSRKDGQTCAARWDLDQVAVSNDWLVEIPDLDEIPWTEHLGSHGTLVVWEKIDRLIDINEPSDRSNMIRQIDEAAEHLALVFHRFLDGERGLKKISLSLNGRKLESIDPFHSEHPATQIGPSETVRLGGHDITIQAFTLPHHKKVSATEWEKYARREGYIKNQGFYVYRGKRLIIYGTWFGLARQMELTKLARVRIDMPNGLDTEWKIDVKKSSAQPPGPVRERLRRIIETIGAASKRVYTARGRKLVSDSRLPVWMRVQDKNEIFYVLNQQHPVFAGFVAQLSEEMQTEFRKILEITGATIPIDALFADVSGSPEKVLGAPLSDDSLASAVETTFKSLISSGVSAPDIRDMLSVTEPFRSRWDEASRKLEALVQGVTANA